MHSPVNGNGGLVEDDFDVIPVGLKFCFNRQIFQDEYFDAMDFLRTRHLVGQSLEEVFASLLQYFNVLKNGLVELINRDYSVFVRLSQNLIGLDKSIVMIKAPLEHYRAQITEFKNDLVAKITLVEELLREQTELDTNRKLIRDLQDVEACVQALERWLQSYEQHRTSQRQQLQQRALGSSQVETAFDKLVAAYEQEQETCDDEELAWPEYLSVDSLTIPSDPSGRFDWITNEYIKLHYFLKKCPPDTAFLVKLQQRIQRITDNLLDRMEEQLKNALATSRKELAQMLQVYRSLEKVHLAERTIRLEVFRPRLSRALIAKVELTSASASAEMSALAFQAINIDSLTLFDELRRSMFDGMRINLLVGCFWPEYASFVLSLSEIYNYASPNRFQRLYQEAMRFLHQLEQRCCSSEELTALHAHAQYQEFVKRWDFSLYFRLRVQEAEQRLEAGYKTSLLLASPTSASHNAKLVMTQCLLDELHKIWFDDHVYLNQLRHKFVKFTLQSLKVYLKMAQTEAKRDSREIFKARQVAGSTTTSLDSSLALIHDLKLLLVSLSEEGVLFRAIITRLQQRIGQALWPELREKVHLAIKQNTDPMEQILAVLIQQQSQVFQYECSILLRQMNEIPRQYRRTNRDMPTSASSYANSLHGTLTRLAQAVQALQLEPEAVAWPELRRLVQDTLRGCVADFDSQLREVLGGIRKAGDSLRKLREARGGGANTFATSSDDDKMRQQLLLDANSFIGLIRENDILKEESLTLSDKLDELLHQINRAQTEAASS